MKEIREKIKKYSKGWISKKRRRWWSSWYWYWSRDKFWIIRGNRSDRIKHKNHLESDKSETYETDHREHTEILKRFDSLKIGDEDNPVVTNIDLETNVTKKTELITSALVARQLTENQYDKVDAEEEMSFENLTISGNYSDYDILEEEKETITKNDDIWVKTKKEILRGRVLLIPYS